MAVTPGKLYNPSTKSFVGDAENDKALVFMIRCIHFSPNTFEKMRVKTSYHLAHQNVAAALMVLAAYSDDGKFVHY